MAISRERKEELVAQYVDFLQQSNGFIVVQFKGLTVPQMENMRGKIRGANGAYMVTKNTLLTKALEQIGWPVPENLLNGPTGIAFGMDNLPGVAKAVLDYAKEIANEERILVTGGVMGESLLDAKAVDSVSNLPTLDELRAQIAGLVVAPAQGIVNVINAANSQVVNVIQAYLDDRGEGEAA